MADSRWDDVYDRGDSRVSWFQAEPIVSLRLLHDAGLHVGSSVIDIGGGASCLADRLVERGVRDVTVLDVAESALQISRKRLGSAADRVTWLAEDLRQWRPARRFDLWHDRATFHFLTEPGDRAEYASVLQAALDPHGRVVIGAFAEDGPALCSGLPVARYTPADLSAQFPGLRVMRVEREEHRTPWGAIQPFTWVILCR